ncbi:MAG: hypothetical protein JWL81_496 [Verrucomicrobiales bacterium]|nr:hypothetical protein [Verrucomicrobiales bacterium]
MEKKLHRILAEAAVGILKSVFEDGMVADRAVGRVLGANPKWGRRDRAFVAETVYEIIRRKRRLEVLAGSAEWWSVCGFWWGTQGYARPEWAAWDEVAESVRIGRGAELEAMPAAVRFSTSDAFDALGRQELGAGWEVELAAMDHAAPVYLRVNPRRGNLSSVIAALEAGGVAVEPVPGCALGLKLAAGKSVSAQMRESGLFEIQDAGSQQVAPFCQVAPGMRVVDACAGAGGKTLHLAALMEGQGDLLAMDVQERKLETLKHRAARATVKVRTALIDDAVLTKNRALADRVLVDAPCSGSGTLRRQADLKYRIDEASVAENCRVQREVLERCAPLVRPGGKLIYATCSILPCENAGQVSWFSGAHPEFELEEQHSISPAETGWDGFFMARWRRKD